MSRAIRPAGEVSAGNSEPATPLPDGIVSVSYTHLTLPTILRV